MATGIDKLMIDTIDFQVKEVNSSIFGIDTTIHQGGDEGELPYLFTDKRGREVRANKIYHNPKDGKGVANYTIQRLRNGNTGLMVQFNPSKIIHPYNLVEVNSKNYKDALEKVEGDMNSIGIQANLSNMTINRIDIAKQSQMNLPCNQYQDAFRLLKGVRQKHISMEGGYYFKNKSTEAIFYDKRQELKYHKMENILLGEKNFMRAEIKALNKVSVASVMHINTLGSLCQVDTSDINTYYNKYINTRVFGKENESVQTIIDFDGEVGIMKHYLSMGRGGWEKYLYTEGLDICLLKFGGIDGFAKLLTEAGMQRSNLSKSKQKIEKMLQEKAKADKIRNNITPSTLIAELKEKFAV